MECTILCMDPIWIDFIGYIEQEAHIYMPFMEKLWRGEIA